MYVLWYKSTQDNTVNLDSWLPPMREIQLYSTFLIILQEDDASKSSPDSCADTADLNQESNGPVNLSIAGSEDSDKLITKEAFELEFPIGSMVWGKLPGYNWWPGNVISYDVIGGLNDEKEEKEEEESSSNVRAWVKWYGETQLSKV